jgi:hypothetical protein
MRAISKNATKVQDVGFSVTAFDCGASIIPVYILRTPEKGLVHERIIYTHVGCLSRGKGRSRSDKSKGACSGELHG